MEKLAPDSTVLPMAPVTEPPIANKSYFLPGILAPGNVNVIVLLLTSVKLVPRFITKTRNVLLASLVAHTLKLFVPSLILD